MLLPLLNTERMKLKRSPLWLAFLLMPLIPALLGSVNYLGNIEILTKAWYSLWTQHTLFTCYFFLPIMLGIYCSYIIHQEEDHHNWSKVLTMPVSRRGVFQAKLITAGSMLLLSELWIVILFILSGKIIGITAPLPVIDVIQWCLCGTFGGMVLVSMQLVISLLLKGFALPVGIALGGGLSGLFFLTRGMGHIWPYSLMAYGMNANAPQELLQSGYPFFIIVCCLYIALFTVIGNIILSKRDI